MNILEMYHQECKRKSDINEHLPTLKKYSEKCTHVTEFGVRGVVSTWALLAGKPKTMYSYDIMPCKINDALQLANEAGINFTFTQANVLEIKIEETDLLFIDTLHDYDQLKKELSIHSEKVRKYLVFHDTVSYGIRGETKGQLGIMSAIEEFLKKNRKKWRRLEEFKNNNGLLILERISI